MALHLLQAQVERKDPPSRTRPRRTPIINHIQKNYCAVSSLILLLTFWIHSHPLFKFDDFSVLLEYFNSNRKCACAAGQSGAGRDSDNTGHFGDQVDIVSSGGIRWFPKRDAIFGNAGLHKNVERIMDVIFGQSEWLDCGSKDLLTTRRVATPSFFSSDSAAPSHQKIMRPSTTWRRLMINGISNYGKHVPLPGRTSP